MSVRTDAASALWGKVAGAYPANSLVYRDSIGYVSLVEGKVAWSGLDFTSVTLLSLPRSETRPCDVASLLIKYDIERKGGSPIDVVPSLKNNSWYLETLLHLLCNRVFYCTSLS